MIARPQHAITRETNWGDKMDAVLVVGTVSHQDLDLWHALSFQIQINKFLTLKIGSLKPVW